MSKTTIEIPQIGSVDFVNSTRARRLSITVKSDGSVRVAVPRGISIRKARSFLSSRIEWVVRSREKLGSRRVPRGKLPPVDRNRARVVLAGRLNKLARRHGFMYNRLYVRNQKTRWGSCSSKNNISLNMNLVSLPGELRDYVILHELVHTRHKNHSREFWAELDGLVGDSKQFKKEMRKYRLG
jgi:predicted metal-dependent hydrolase